MIKAPSGVRTTRIKSRLSLVSRQAIQVRCGLCFGRVITFLITHPLRNPANHRAAGFAPSLGHHFTQLFIVDQATLFYHGLSFATFFVGVSPLFIF
jgi:hypothetical protein